MMMMMMRCILRVRIPSKFAQSAGLTSCLTLGYTSKMHRNISFPDERTQKFSVDWMGLNSLSRPHSI